MSDQFNLDADSPTPPRGNQDRFNLTQEEAEGENLLEEERRRQQILADEDSEQSMPQQSSNQGSNRLADGNSLTNGIHPIKEEESNLDPASSMQVGVAQNSNQQLMAHQQHQELQDDVGEDDEEDDDYEENYDQEEEEK